MGSPDTYAHVVHKRHTIKKYDFCACCVLIILCLVCVHTLPCAPSWSTRLRLSNAVSHVFLQHKLAPVAPIKVSQLVRSTNHLSTMRTLEKLENLGEADMCLTENLSQPLHKKFNPSGYEKIQISRYRGFENCGIGWKFYVFPGRQFKSPFWLIF